MASSPNATVQRRVIPIASGTTALGRDRALRTQRWRTALQVGFFILFILAPVFDLFRYDLHADHAWLLGMEWRLGLDPFLAGEASALEAAGSIIVNLFLPLLALAALIIGVAWRWGRLYCGWLCPHFSVVETINGLMRRASGKPTLWEKKPLPERLPDGRVSRPDRRWWPVTLLAVALFSFVWALTLLTYLLPPDVIYANLLGGTLTRNQSVFLIAGTLAFMAEFLLARHLFCRFGCAVGLFQSLVWMANKRAMVVGYDGARASSCADCNAACDNACPMRLKPRSIKRKMFTCTQCAECISACTQVQAPHGQPPLLQWVEEECARLVSDREHGRPLPAGGTCFKFKVEKYPGPRIDASQGLGDSSH